MNQRWLLHKERYRPAGEPIRTAAYDVAEIGQDSVARGFVLAHHYSKSYPAARFRFGLYHQGELAGVAVFSHPVRNSTITNLFGGTATDGVELGRFVLLDQVPGNGETWFLARCFELLRKRDLQGVVSFSDPEPRTDVHGRVVHPGHVGCIYQAHNAQYLGRSEARRHRLLPDGRIFSPRAIAKIRKREKGWEGAVAQLVAYGVAAPGEHELCAWLDWALPLVTRPFQHPGNHKYAWDLTKQRRQFAGEFAYPKKGVC